METTTNAAADSYGIGLPDQWNDYPLEKKAFEAAVTSQLQALEGEGVSVADRRKLELVHRQLRELLLGGKVRYAAGLAATSPSGENGDQTLVVASAAISKRSRTEMGSPVPITAELLVRGLSQPDEDETAMELAPPTRVELAAGPGCKLVRMHRVKLSSTESSDAYAHSYLVPHDDGEALCILQLVTPSIGYVEEFGRLFDAIAQTLRIFKPGDPTTFDLPEDASAVAGEQS